MALLTASCTDLGQLHIGDQVFRRYEVRDEYGILTNSSITATLTEPDGDVVSLTAVPEATGEYMVTFPPFTQRGYYQWVIAATGPVYKVDKGSLHVKP